MKAESIPEATKVLATYFKGLNQRNMTTMAAMAMRAVRQTERSVQVCSCILARGNYVAC
jgi:hypothetical protein